jgi:hypothetical protein
MGKLAPYPRNLRPGKERRLLARLKDERRKLSSRLAKLDRRLTKLDPRNSDRKAPNSVALYRWLDELSAGLDDLQSLPHDFNRDDLYDDHD